MSSNPYEIARKQAGGLTIAVAPARVSWEVPNLATADGHFLRANFHASLRALDALTERKMLAEVFLTDRAALSVQTAADHYRRPLHDAAARAVREKPVDHWLADDGRAALCELLRKTAGDVSFTCGLEVLGPIRLELESPTLAQQQLQAMQRTLAEQQAAGRIEHFQRATDLLRKFESARGDSATVVAQSIESLNPADRGAMLKTLLLAGSSKAVSNVLWAVAGTSLIRIDLAGNAAPTAIELPNTLGPFRSVQSVAIDNRQQLVIGARDGVLTIADPGRPEAVCYRDSGVESTQGFSRVIVRPSQLVACHGEAGIVTWNLGQPDRPEKLARPAALGGSPRNLQPLGSKAVLFSIGPQLVSMTDDGSIQRLGPAGPGNVIAIVPDEHRFYIVYDEGTISALERVTKTLITLEHRGRRVSTAAGLPWLGGLRLLLAGDDGAIDCIGPDDDLLSQYVSPHRGARQIIASTSHVAALSADRSRVILWNSWEGKSPVREISVARLTPHRVADLLLS